MLAAGETNESDKFAKIRAALESRDDEQLTRLLNQRCVQLRAIGMAKETKLDFDGMPKYKRGHDLFRYTDKIFLKLSLCSGGGELEQWVWELNELNLGIKFPVAVKARTHILTDLSEADSDTIKMILEQEERGAMPDPAYVTRRTNDPRTWQHGDAVEVLVPIETELGL